MGFIILKDYFMILLVLNTEKIFRPPIGGRNGLFYFCPSLEQAKLGPKIKKPCRFHGKAFSV
jgi:hypothetical protein